MVVTRLAYKNNSSKYKLGEQSSNFTEITTLLRQRGIDLDHNRFLILQGEVEQVKPCVTKFQNMYVHSINAT